MSVHVKLTDIVIALESASMENRYFVERKTGEIVLVSNEFLSKAEDGELYDGMIEWQQEMMELANQIIENEASFIEIDSLDIHEYGMME